LKEAQLFSDIRFIYNEVDNMELKEISYIANYLNENEKLIQIYGIKGDERAQFYISRSKDLNINLQDIFKKTSSQFSIKGGGNPNTVQGSISNEQLKSLLDNFAKYIIKEIKVRNS